MHYGSYDFAINSTMPTITAIDGSRTKGHVFTKVHPSVDLVYSHLQLKDFWMMITGGRGQVESDVQLWPDRLLGRRSSDGKLHSTGRCWTVHDQHGRDDGQVQEIVPILWFWSINSGLHNFTRWELRRSCQSLFEWLLHAHYIII